MRTHTDSSTIVHHEDGSWTETTEVTRYPATKQEKAIALTCLVGIIVAPVAPLLFVASCEKAAVMRDKYRAKRVAKKNENK